MLHKGFVFRDQSQSVGLVQVLHASRVVDEVAELHEEHRGILDRADDVILVAGGVVVRVVDWIGHCLNKFGDSVAEVRGDKC